MQAGCQLLLVMRVYTNQNISNQSYIPVAVIIGRGDVGVQCSIEAYESLARFFSLLSEPARLRLLHALIERECSVSELLASTGLSQANGSRHLGLMYQAGVLSRRREGSQVFYRLSDEMTEALGRRLSEQLACICAEESHTESVFVSIPPKEEASV
jgi:DNA-binding transcriptional ArsR family regulator